MSKRLRATAGPWGACPIALLTDARVTPNMLKVYVALSAYQGTNDSCYPSRDEISDRTGIGASGVSKAITDLVAAGWIVRERRPQRHISNRYHVLYDVSNVRESETFGHSESPRNSDIESPGNSDIPPCPKRSGEEITGPAPEKSSLEKVRQEVEGMASEHRVSLEIHADALARFSALWDTEGEAVALGTLSRFLSDCKRKGAADLRWMLGKDQIDGWLAKGRAVSDRHRPMQQTPSPIPGGRMLRGR